MESAIGELARQSGVTRRTIRYYVEIGLLPPPSSEGRAALYSDEHLQTLLHIKKLQAMRLSLDEIREQLAGKAGSSGHLATLAVADVGSVSPESAADYVLQLRQRLEPAPADASQQVREQRPIYEAEPWMRITLTPDVELNVRRRGSRIDRRIAKLIKEARRILEEEETL